MNEDAGGWLWLLIDVLFVAALGAALIYGTMMWRSRRKNRAMEDRRDAVTKAHYQVEAMKEEAAPDPERVK